MDFALSAFSYFSHIVGFALITTILTHIICTYWPRRKLELTQSTLIIITGGCMGIGKQMALEFARKYAPTILIIDRRDDLFEAVGIQLSKLKCKAIFKKVDLSNDKQINAVIEEIKKQFDKIDLFVYNAGIVIPKRGSQTTGNQNNLIMKVNYFTPALMINGLESKLYGGHIAVVSSMTALASGGINFGTYGASKSAIYHYISSLRQEYKKDKKNISLSICCPFAINTGMFHGFKMLIEFIVPVLDEVYVGKRMVKQFVDRKEVCYIYQYAGWILRVMEMFPSQILDLSWIYLDSSNYSEIKDKHDNWIKVKKSE